MKRNQKRCLQGKPKRADICEFTSDNTQILNVEEVKEKLLSLDYVRNELSEWKM